MCVCMCVSVHEHVQSGSQNEGYYPELFWFWDHFVTPASFGDNLLKGRDHVSMLRNSDKIHSASRLVSQ